MKIYNLVRKRGYSVVFLLFVFFVIFTSIFYLTSKKSHESYWSSIYRVQTVDFNIISSSYPFAISYLLEHGESLDGILNSNYSIFRMAYESCANADCSEFTETYANNKKYNSYVEKINIPVYKDYTEKGPLFDSPYSVSPNTIDYRSDQLLGRLVVYRPNHPSYVDDMLSFINKYVDNNDYASRHIAYRANLYSALGFGLTGFLILFALRNYYIEQIGRKVIAENLRDRFSRGERK